jgi:hypothetical protein
VDNIPLLPAPHNADTSGRHYFVFIGQLEIQIGPRDFLFVTSVLYELYDSFASIINEIGKRQPTRNGPIVAHFSRTNKFCSSLMNEIMKSDSIRRTFRRRQHIAGP